MKQKLFSLVSTIIILLTAAVLKSYSQSPGTGSTEGYPLADHFYSVKGVNIWSNLDGSAQTNEYIYFNVVPPNGGNQANTLTWYSNATAWLTHNEFHLNKAALKMHGNPISINKGGYIELGADAEKEKDAGKIGYQIFTDGLDIVGAGKTTTEQKINFYNEGGATFNGGVFITPVKSPKLDKSTHGISEALLNKYLLFVREGILSEDYAMAPRNEWSDYVFDKNYRLPSLDTIENFIQINHHLPGIPSLKEVQTDGYNLHEINVKLLEKIEELTLYSISQQKKIVKQAEEHEELVAKIKKIEKILGLSD